MGITFAMTSVTDFLSSVVLPIKLSVYQRYFKMLLIDFVVYILFTIKELLCTMIALTITEFKVEKKIVGKLTKMGVHQNLSTANRPPRTNCQGCTPPKAPIEELQIQTPTARKLFKKDLANAGFAKPTLSSLRKKNHRSESPEPFQKSLRKYKKSRSTVSVLSQNTFVYTSSRHIEADHSSSSSENVTNSSSIQLCYAAIGEIERMDEEVSCLPETEVEKFESTCTEVTEDYELGIANISSIEVFQAVTVKQDDSDDSQIFSDSSRPRTPTPEGNSNENNVSDDSQIFSDDSLETEAENQRRIEEERAREEDRKRRIANGFAKIDSLAESLNAEEDPVYKRVFGNLKNVTVYLCNTSDNWELGKNLQV